ncbi:MULTISPECIES: helix-turn-helix transcriptional regulator [Caproicibacterium]|uniref:AraC family transcriptional regulator n=1 Tax=Caproicibacterium argilliputei TaxID=3030016 RepID=A0AA97DAW0_9FIRM|nr:AraC family transcriptional regulator [Caproicibacterium argilliputei]WOC33009.1 AraC family transcriptional regulator [Caproicibacterium argilliputei]
MQVQDRNSICNIFPHIFYTVNRVALPEWFLDNRTACHNLMLVYGGRAEFTCNGTAKPAAAGDLFYFKPGDYRTAHTFADCPMKSFAVDFTYICPTFFDGTWQSREPALPFSFQQHLAEPYLMDRLTTLFFQMNETALSVPDPSDRQVREIFTQILLLLFQAVQRRPYDFSAAQKVETVIHYMTRHFTEPLTLAQLAACVQISESYLGKIFKTVTGKSPVDYLIGIRISRAKVLLKEGMSVSEASRKAGFSDIYYFSRTFKKREGLSPSAFAAL